MNIKVRKEPSHLRSRCCSSWGITKSCFTPMNRNLLSWKLLNPTHKCFNPTQMLQSNTNASLKNLETQVGQLALTLQNHNKNAFLSDTQKNPKDCMAVQLRSGKEMSNSRVEEKEKNDKKEEKATGGVTLRNIPSSFRTCLGYNKSKSIFIRNKIKIK